MKKILFSLVAVLISLMLFSHSFSEDYSIKLFEKDTDFSHREFQSKANFERIFFSSVVNFQGARFNSLVDFNTTCFFDQANFIFTKFYKGAFFHGAEFNSAVTFKAAKFYSTVYFPNAKFNSSTDFSGAEFYDTSNFSFVRFGSIVDFQATKFKSDAQFWITQFDTIANFSHAIFESNADFRKVKLPHILNFQSVKINEGVVNLIDAEIDSIYGGCRINLINADIEKILLQYSIFDLYFPAGTNTEIKSNVYERLLLNQQKNGFISSFEKLDKEYEEFKYLESGKYGKLEGVVYNWIDKIWWDYGYNKLLILWNTLYLFLIFALINGIFFKYLISKVYFIKTLYDRREKIKIENVLKRYIIVMPLALVFTSLVFFGLKFDINKLKCIEGFKWRKIFKLIYFLTIYISGLICLGYLANFVLST